jgi:hypothetical protein
MSSTKPSSSEPSSSESSSPGGNVENHIAEVDGASERQVRIQSSATDTYRKAVAAEREEDKRIERLIRVTVRPRLRIADVEARSTSGTS